MAATGVTASARSMVSAAAFDRPPPSDLAGIHQSRIAPAKSSMGAAGLTRRR